MRTDFCVPKRDLLSKPNNLELVHDLVIKGIDTLTSENQDYFSDSKSSRRSNLHSLFRYPAMMVPSVQKELIEVVLKADPTIQNMWDPFVGGGTTIVAGGTCRLTCFGQDINPLAVLLTKVKASACQVLGLRNHVKNLCCALKGERFEVEVVVFKGIEKWFKPEVRDELCWIRYHIKSVKSLEVRRFFWVVFAEAIRQCSNDRTTTFKLHCRSSAEISDRNINVIDLFEGILENALSDVEAFQNEYPTNHLHKMSNSGIRIHDTRISELPYGWPKAFDLVVTSPPYGDNVTTVTYGQYSFLQLHWIVLADIENNIDPGVLRTTHEIDQRGLGGRRPIERPKTQELEVASPQIRWHLNSIETRYGGERYRKFLAFAEDFYVSVKNIVSHTSPTGIHVWTIGNRRIGDEEIRNDQILKDLMKHFGMSELRSIGRQIKNKRMPARNDGGVTMKAEQIIIFRNGREPV